MFRVFISYAPEDMRVLADFLKWLEPLRQKHFLHIYYNRYNKYDLPNHQKRAVELHSANLYLFITSYHSVANSVIQGEEVGAAMARQGALGNDMVRIRPILLSPSHWKENSRLLLFQKNALPASKELSRFDPKEDGFVEIMNTLQTDIEYLRVHLIEDYKLRGLATDGFFKEYALPKAIAPSKWNYRFAKLKEMGWVLLILSLIWSMYQIGCVNKMYPDNRYVPPVKNDKIYELE